MQWHIVVFEGVDLGLDVQWDQGVWIPGVTVLSSHYLVQWCVSNYGVVGKGRELPYSGTSDY